MSRTPTGTVQNATSGANDFDFSLMDQAFRPGVVIDAAGIGAGDTNDTDLDRTGLIGVQGAAGE